jgi:protein-S-isoprenylcysteine O-methyltransferase Ste14
MSLVVAPKRSIRSRQNLVLILPLLLFAGWRLATRHPGPLLPADFLLATAGTLFLAAGLWLRLCARQWKAERSHDGLVTDGLYGYVRHPLYAGSFLLGLGLSLVLRDGLLLLAYIPVFWLSHAPVIRREEADLEQRFGPEYATYRRRVPALLPRPASEVSYERGPVLPRRLREAVVRESDALCIWLAVPLFVGLGEWAAAGSAGSRWLPALLVFGILLLACAWIRLKQEYRTLARAERARRVEPSRRQAA